MGGGRAGDGDGDPGPGTPTPPPAKSPRTPSNDESERAGAPATRDDPGRSARATDDGHGSERDWSNGTTTIDLDLVRMLDQGRSYTPGKFHTVVVWHGATHTTAVELDDADRDSLHEAFAACARQRPKR